MLREHQFSTRFPRESPKIIMLTCFFLFYHHNDILLPNISNPLIYAIMHK